MPKQEISTMAAAIDHDLRTIRQILRRPMEAEIAKAGLTGPQQSAMRALINSGGLSLKDLSRELGLAHSTVSGIVDRLERRGMVIRQSDGADRRLTRVVVSDQVRQHWRNAWPLLERHPLAEALRAATRSQREEALRGIRTLRRLLELRNENRLAAAAKGNAAPIAAPGWRPDSRRSHTAR